jgi:hypothetical protein
MRINSNSDLKILSRFGTWQRKISDTQSSVSKERMVKRNKNEKKEKEKQ